MTTSTRTRRDEQSDEAAARGLGTAGWTALGTSVHVLVTDPSRLAAARRAVEQVLADVDLAASRFRPDSELTRLNQAAGEWVAVSPLLEELVRTALDAAAWTEGLVDPTVGRALVDLGYDRTYRLVPADGPALTVAQEPVPGWERVEVAEGHVRMPTGTVLDLGATAKGLAADLAAEAAHDATGCGVLVNLGGDLAGAGGGPPDGWPVLVTDLSDPDVPAGATAGQTVLITSGGVATSGTAARRWRRGGSLLHHLIDPRSGLPAQSPWRTASVAAYTCVLANTASTAAVVLGADAPAWLSDRGFAARLTRTDGRVVTVGGWPSDVGAA